MPQIRAVLDEMLQGSQADLTPQVQAILLASLLDERIRSGELTRFDAEFAHAWRLAADVLHSPELQIALRMVASVPLFRRRRPSSAAPTSWSLAIRPS